MVGALRRQYTLFGDTVNLASRMESTGQPGRVQVSQVGAVGARDSSGLWVACGCGGGRVALAAGDGAGAGSCAGRHRLVTRHVHVHVERPRDTHRHNLRLPPLHSAARASSVCELPDPSAAHVIFMRHVRAAESLQSPTGLVAQVTYELLKDRPQYKWESRGEVFCKGKGVQRTYLLATDSPVVLQEAALEAELEAAAAAAGGSGSAGGGVVGQLLDLPTDGLAGGSRVCSFTSPGGAAEGMGGMGMGMGHGRVHGGIGDMGVPHSVLSTGVSDGSFTATRGGGGGAFGGFGGAGLGAHGSFTAAGRPLGRQLLTNALMRTAQQYGRVLPGGGGAGEAGGGADSMGGGVSVASELSPLEAPSLALTDAYGEAYDYGL